MSTTSTATAIDPWQVGRLDVDAYLARLGLTGTAGRPPDLHELHGAHVRAIPFENIDIVLGRPIDLDVDAIQGKLVERRRGGYCFEHALLYAAALERLGHQVVRLSARVQPDRPGPRTHQLVIARHDGDWWLTDVGFGGNLLAPIRLADTTARQGGWTYRLRQSDDRWRLQVRREDAWGSLYDFTTEPAQPIDLVVANHFTSTHPRSPFVGQLVVFGIEPARRLRLTDHRLTIERPDGRREHRDLSSSEVLDTLATDFRIDLDENERTRLAAHLDHKDAS